MSPAADFLASVEPFRRLPRVDVEKLSAVARVERFAPGATLHEQGGARVGIRVLRSGFVDLVREDDVRGRRRLVTYERGDVLGYGVLIADGTHTTAGLARDEVSTLFLPKDELRTVLEADPLLRGDLLSALLTWMTERWERMLPTDHPDTLLLLQGRQRIEHDLIGDREIPADAYFGVQTLRAVENFPITGQVVGRHADLVAALAWVKLAAARANHDCGVLDAPVRDAIVAACEELLRGRLADQFVVDVIQGGAGTSTNMNANEVIANRALEHLGRAKGDYAHCHPNNHVNASQSTNDVYPSALKLAVWRAHGRLAPQLEGLAADLRGRAEAFADVVTMGRTQLQDAVPMTLGQAFAAFARGVEGELADLCRAADALLELNLGGTAIGTGLNAPAGFARSVIAHLRDVTGAEVRLADDLVNATTDMRAFTSYSGALKSLAVRLIKVADDLRLLSSGPRTGLGEIRLPPMQPGSSIMPGKVNPVIPEVVCQVAHRIIGNDLTVTFAAASGELQLNAMEPVIGASLLESVEIAINAIATFRAHCVRGIEADRVRCRANVESSIGVVTALVPVLGYELCSELAAEALRTGAGLVELVRARGLLDEARIAAILAPERMAHPQG